MGCKKAQGFLAAQNLEVKDQSDAGKERRGRKEALELAKSVEKIVVGKGKKVITFDMKAEPPDDDGCERGTGETDGQRHQRVDERHAVAEPCQQISGQAEERGVRQADEPRVPDQQIEAHREDAGDHRLAEELQPEPVAGEGRHE